MHGLGLTAFQTRALKTVGVVSGVAAAGSVAAQNRDRLGNLKLPLNCLVIEALSGAAGEVAQTALVYPLDTLKVRCQAEGLNSRQVIESLWKSTGGNWNKIVAALYAGILPAMSLAVLVGAVHYVSFCVTRRTLSQLTEFGKQQQQRDGSGQLDMQQQQQQQQQQHHHHHQKVIVSHGMTGTHFVPIEDGDDAACAGSSSSGGSSSSSSSNAGASHASAACAAVDDAPTSFAEEVGEGSMALNVAAAVITAVITALVEAPVEMFRHTSQAGYIQSNFVKEMHRVLHTSGPGALYYGMIPYCFESWPYDISELLVVGAAKDIRASPALRHIQPAAFDLAVGGVAGTVAVLVSMPFDVVKTYMQTHGAHATEAFNGSAGAFWATGRALVAKRGPGALFVGLAPRLAHQVPGAMVCWLVIESCHRYLSSVAAAHMLADQQAQQQQ